MIKKKDINEALINIAKLIKDQTNDGQQSKLLQAIDSEVFALGQFLNDLTRQQRGIHGTSAGLIVLAEHDANHILIKGLIKYLENRKQFESSLNGKEDLFQNERLTRDEDNIIKLSEILYSLSFVSAGQASKEEFTKQLAKKIMDAKCDSSTFKGWSFFISDNNQKAELLPTAFAVLALERNGFKELEIRNSLESQLFKEEINSPSTLAICVFCLYTLMQSKKENENSKLKPYKDLFHKIWSSPYASMQNDYEQNLEYWNDVQHDYIRIPWQIYFLAISSQLSKWRFYTVNFQNRLKSLVDKAKQKGFIYPHSSPYISTRTNSILFVSLEIIRENMNHSFGYSLLVKIDRIRQFLGSTLTRRMAMALGISIMIYISYKWYTDSKTHFTDVAPELFASFILTLTTLGKKNEVR
jgi:hypothetical protein